MNKNGFKLMMISGVVMLAAGLLFALAEKWICAALVWAGGMCCLGAAVNFRR